MLKTWLSGIAGLAAILIALAWWFGWYPHEDELIAQTRTVMEKPREEQTKDEQSALRDAWGERMKGMSDEQRQAMMEAMMPIMVPIFMKQFENNYDKFMAMSPEQQRQELDKRIDEMQKRGGPGGGRPGGPGGGGFGGGGRANMDPKKMAEFQKKMLAWTTPEQRAKFDTGMQIFNNRLVERGMQPIQLPGGGIF